MRAPRLYKSLWAARLAIAAGGVVEDGGRELQQYPRDRGVGDQGSNRFGLQRPGFYPVAVRVRPGGNHADCLLSDFSV